MVLHSLNSGVAFSFGEKLTSSDANQVRTDAADVTVGTDLGTDADQTIVLADGTTYATTMTQTALRNVDLPVDVTTAGNSRLYFKIRHDSAGFNLVFRTDSPTTVVTVSGAGVVEGWLELYYDNATWRTANVRAGTSTTITVSQ